MKNLLFAVIAIVGVYLLFFSGERYELVDSGYGDTNTFTHSSHGYSLQLPRKYFEPEGDCPLRTSNLELSTYFRASGDPSTIFIVGEIEGRFREHMIDNLNLLEKNHMNEEQFLNIVGNANDANEIMSVDGVPVFISTTSRSSNSTSMVMFRVDSTLVGFMVAHSAKQTKEIHQIIETIEII